MPYYNLVIVEDHRVLTTVAADREGAIADFEKELGERLSLSPENDSVAPYLMDEWDGQGPHWINATIPVFQISN